MLQPPRPPSLICWKVVAYSYFYALALAIILFLIVLVCQKVLPSKIPNTIHNPTLDIVVRYVVVPAYLLTIAGINIAIHYPKKARNYQKKLNEYENSWFCQRCGTISILDQVTF
jgi:hypothetical protein